MEPIVPNKFWIGTTALIKTFSGDERAGQYANKR